MTAEHQNIIKERRKELGLSQMQLADKAGISVRTLQNIEQLRYGQLGGTNSKLIYKISKALGISIEEILENGGIE